MSLSSVLHQEAVRPATSLQEATPFLCLLAEWTAGSNSEAVQQCGTPSQRVGSSSSILRRSYITNGPSQGCDDQGIISVSTRSYAKKWSWGMPGMRDVPRYGWG